MIGRYSSILTRITHPTFARRLMQPRPICSGHAAWLPLFLRRLTDTSLVAFVLFVSVSISMMQGAYILATAAWLLHLCLQGGARPRRLPLMVTVGGFALASLLATMTAIAPCHSLRELRNILEIAVFYVTVNTVRSDEHATLLVSVLLAASALMALYGLPQSLVMGPAFRLAGASTYMTFGGQLMLFCSMALAQVLFHPRSRHLPWRIPVLAILLAALVQTQTRNAWLGFGVACLIILACAKSASCWSFRFSLWRRFSWRLLPCKTACAACGTCGM